MDLELLADGWHAVVPILLTLAEIAGVLSAWHAIRFVRTSQAAVAWSVGLIAMPLVAIPAYWVFGRSRFYGYREAIRQVQQRHYRSVSAAYRELHTRRNLGTAAANAPLEHVADAMDTPVCRNNAFQLLVDGRAFFDAMFAMIEEAERYVYAEFYILVDDEIGNQFADCLIRKARQGVQVRILYDEIGSRSISNPYLQRLQDAGVDVQSFNTRQGLWNRLQLNFRNHRKLVVADGQSAIVGGLNISDEYLAKPAWVTRWRDTSMSVRGPAARKVQAVFAADYYWAARHHLPEAEWNEAAKTASHQSVPDPYGSPQDSPETRIIEASGQPSSLASYAPEGTAAVFATGPSDFRSRASILFMAAASTATKRFWISTPYLIPDDATMTALSLARARGIDVRVLIPSQADFWLVYLASFYYEAELAELDIPVYRYRDGFLHQKCILVDDRFAMIGSINLDQRSLHLNFEVMLGVGDPAAVREVQAMLEEDFAHAERSDRQGGRLRPWYIRLGTIMARLFSPVL